MNNETRSPQGAAFAIGKQGRKFLPHQPVLLIKCKGQTALVLTLLQKKKKKEEEDIF